jgi:hypothetical protein
MSESIAADDNRRAEPFILTDTPERFRITRRGALNQSRYVDTSEKSSNTCFRSRACGRSSRPRYFLALVTWPRPSRTSFPLKCALSTRFTGSDFSPRAGSAPL